MRASLVGDPVDPVAGVTQGVEQVDDGRGGVEAHGVAEAAALGGVGRQDDGDPLVGGGEAAEPGVADGEPGDRATRSGSVRLAMTGVPRSSPSSTSSLKAKAGATMRPSNSGMATPMATSRG